MFLDGLGQAIGSVFHKIADFAHLRAEPEPSLPRDTLRVSTAARAASQTQQAAPASTTPAVAATDLAQPDQSQTYSDLVYRGPTHGVAQGNMISYIPGQESSGFGAIKVADNGSTPIPGTRGNRRQAPPSVFV